MGKWKNETGKENSQGGRLFVVCSVWNGTLETELSHWKGKGAAIFTFYLLLSLDEGCLVEVGWGRKGTLISWPNKTCSHGKKTGLNLRNEDTGSKGWMLSEVDIARTNGIQNLVDHGALHGYGVGWLT